MARSLDTTFTSEKNAQTSRPVYIYTVHSFDGTKNLCLTNYDSDIVYNGITYSAFPINHDNIGENNTGEIPSVRVSISNVSRLIQAYLETYELRRKKVTIRMIWANQLADTDAYTDDIYYIDSYTADQNNVVFTLKSKFDLMGLELPGRKFSRNNCSWVFKGAECKYAGSESSCVKTLTRCRELSNTVNYGGVPGVPSKRIFGSW